MHNMSGFGGGGPAIGNSQFGCVAFGVVQLHMDTQVKFVVPF